MSNKKNYPDWGAFGTATENVVLEPRPTVDPDTGDDTWEMKIKVGEVEIETNPTDTPEQIKAAMQKAHDLNALQATTKRGRLRLVKSDHALKSFIEEAMARAGVTSFNEVEPVWRELVSMAEGSDAPNHVIGYIASRRALKYQGTTYDNTGQPDFYKKAALAQLFRRQKTHAGQRQPTPADAA